MKFHRAFVVLTALFAPLARANAAVGEDCKSLAELLGATPELSGLLDLIGAANMTAAVSDPAAQLTVLAPTNTAIAAVPPATLAAAAADPELLAAVLKDHIFEGVVTSEDLLGGTDDMWKLENIAGNIITVNVENGITFTGPNGGVTAKLVTGDQMACASVVHIIDNVLLAGTGEPAEVEGGVEGSAEATAASTAAGTAEGSVEGGADGDVLGEAEETNAEGEAVVVSETSAGFVSQPTYVAAMLTGGALLAAMLV